MGNACQGVQAAPEAPLSTVSEAVVLCGPVVGKVTTTTAIVMLEVDAAKTITCVAAPVREREGAVVAKEEA